MVFLGMVVCVFSYQQFLSSGMLGSVKLPHCIILAGSSDAKVPERVDSHDRGWCQYLGNFFYIWCIAVVLTRI